MPTMVGATISSIRRNSSVTRTRAPADLGERDSTNEKSGFSAHSSLFGSSREPDEDARGYRPGPAQWQAFLAAKPLLFLMISENRRPPSGDPGMPLPTKYFRLEPECRVSVFSGLMGRFLLF